MGLVKELHADIAGETSLTVQKLGLISKRSVSELLSDAIRLYAWVLHEQWMGRKIVSVPTSGHLRASEEQEDVVEIDRLIQERAAADTFFKGTKWTT